MQESNELQRLKEFKEKYGWSYDRISKELGVHHQSVQGWFSGKYKPSQLAKKSIRAFLIKYPID